MRWANCSPKPVEPYEWFIATCFHFFNCFPQSEYTVSPRSAVQHLNVFVFFTTNRFLRMPHLWARLWDCSWFLHSECNDDIIIKLIKDFTESTCFLICLNLLASALHDYFGGRKCWNTLKYIHIHYVMPESQRCTSIRTFLAITHGNLTVH